MVLIVAALILAIVVAAIVVILFAVLAFSVWRGIGRSLAWRSLPGHRRLTSFGGMEQHPSVDDRERVLVFEAIRERFTEIHVQDLKTGILRTISDPTRNCRRPKVTQDGRIVAYEKILERCPRRRSVLVVHDLERRADRALGDDLDFVLSFAMSGDGSRILVSGVRSETRKVLLYQNGHGREGRELVPGTSEEISPAISADGRTGTFLSSAGHFPKAHFTPCVADLDGGKILSLREDRDCRSLALSADGRRLAYEARGAGGAEIRVVALDSRRVANLGAGLSPVLSSDGHLALFECIDDAYDIVMVDLERQQRTKVVGSNPYPSRMSLAPHGATLYYGSGAFNPLSRTGDTDLFAVDLAACATRNAEPTCVSWSEAHLLEGVTHHSGAPERLRYASGSMWVAAYYFENDGVREDLHQQDSESLAVLAERLSCMVDRVRTLTGSAKVNVVCHCMGGLVAKGAIQYYHEGVLGFSGTDGVPTCEKVNRLVILGAPLRGNLHFGLVTLLGLLRIPYCRKGFRQQARDMTRGSEFLARVNLGPAFRDRKLRNLGSCYKPHGPEAPPHYHSFTCDSYVYMEGGVEVSASRSTGVPGSETHLADDQFALMYETPEGRYSLEGGRPLVHVPEDIRLFDAVAEDKSKALSDYIGNHFEQDIPILFVHGSYLYRGMAELSWLVQLRRLSGEAEGWDRRFCYVESSHEGEGDFWFLDANYC
ncbi:hypothetical protein ACFL59_06685 [Planctomycetota bacterium]